MPRASVDRAPTPRDRLAALARWQLRVLRTQPSARLGGIVAALIALGFGVAVLGARAVTGPGAVDADLAVGAARLAAWCAAGPLLLGAAQGRSLEQRLDGRELVALAHGVSGRWLVASRALAVAFASASLVALPALVVTGAVLGASTTGAEVWERLRVGFAMLPFAFVTGALLGPVAVACERVGRARGRSLFLGAVLVPFAVADPLGLGRASLPGMLEAVLDLGLWALGLQRFA